MTLIALVALSQIADALGYLAASSKGTEANPAAVAVITAFGPAGMVAMKLIVTVVLVAGSVVLIRAGRERAVAWLATIGFVGALSEVAVLG